MTTELDGFPVIDLRSEAGGLEASAVPGAGMVVCSLRHHGDELLGQRRGLRAYVEERVTMGIPLLYPWANRVASDSFDVAGRRVDLDRAAPPPPRRDSAGLAMHGLLSGAHGWRVDRHDGATVRANFDFGAQADLIEAFPFPHRVLYEATLEGSTLSIKTTVEANAGTPVPVAFGYHPYFRLPGTARGDWEVELPVRERLLLDRRMLPTGEREPVEIAAARLGERTFDDAFTAPPHERPFSISDSRRRIEVRFEAGYRFAQVYAPADDEVIAFEPMTAPTNALVDDGPGLPILQPGERYAASFHITVADQT